MSLENISAEVIAAAKRGRIWPLMWVKQAVNNQLPVQEAFASYRQTLGLNDDQCIRLLPIKPLGETAVARGWRYVETSTKGRAFVNEPPLVIGEGDHRTLHCATRTMYVTQIPDALLRGRSAFVEVDDVMLLDYEGEEMARIDQELELDPSIFLATATSAWIPSGPEAVAALEIEEAFNLLGPNTWAFGHWLVEYLPKYIAAVLSGALPLAPVLIDQGMPRQHRQALELIVAAGVEIIEVKPLQTVRVRRLWCAPTHFYAPVLPKINDRFKYDYIASPTAEFTPAAKAMARSVLSVKSSTPGPDKVFLARKPTSNRKLVNHREIEAAAQEQGFVVAYPEDLDFAEQVRLVADARHLAGPDGSALFLAFFAKPGSKLCILNHPHTTLLPTMTVLFAEVGIDCTIVTGPYTRFEPDYPHFSDYQIDEVGFRNFLQHWLAPEAA